MPWKVVKDSLLNKGSITIIPTGLLENPNNTSVEVGF